MRLHRLLREPWFWLIAQPVALLVVLAATGRMTVVLERDSLGYLDFDFSSWHAVLSHTRTVAYPIFLRLVRWLTPSLSAVPYVQLWLHAAAVMALFVGLRRFGFAARSALVCASTLLYGAFVRQHVSAVLTDAPALAMAIMTVASIAAIAGGAGTKAWIALTVSLTLAYQFRPAYLFLVPLAPVLGIALRWLRKRDTAPASWFQFGSGLCLAAAVPLLVFCGLRFLVVGHFGLVSFGGYNVIGIAGQLLDAETIDQLPEQVRPLANTILEREQELPGWKQPPGYYDICDNYAAVVWEVSVPAAQSHFGNNDMLVNERLGELSREIILARPKAYVRWLLPAMKIGMTQVFEFSFLDWPGLVMLAALIVCQFLKASGHRRGVLVRSADAAYVFEYHATLLIAVTFALAKLTLVILVEPPFFRYMGPAAIFFPMWLAVALLDRLSRLLQERAASDIVEQCVPKTMLR
jgi:hypothetical protein